MYPATWNFCDCRDKYPLTHWKLLNGHSRKRTAIHVITATFTKPRFSQLAYKLCSLTFLWVASPSYGHPFCVPRVFTYRSFHCILNCKGSGKCFDDRIFTYRQRAKKIVSNSQGLWILQSGWLILFLTCPKGQWSFLGNSNYTRTVINAAHQKFFGLLKRLLGWYILATTCPNGKP